MATPMCFMSDTCPPCVTAARDVKFAVFQFCTGEKFKKRLAVRLPHTLFFIPLPVQEKINESQQFRHELR